MNIINIATTLLVLVVSVYVYWITYDNHQHVSANRAQGMFSPTELQEADVPALRAVSEHLDHAQESGSHEPRLLDKLVLEATVVMSHREHSYAYIKYSIHKVDRFYAGDLVAGRYQLHKISTDHVLLEQDGQLSLLKLTHRSSTAAIKSTGNITRLDNSERYFYTEYNIDADDPGLSRSFGRDVSNEVSGDRRISYREVSSLELQAGQMRSFGPDVSEIQEPDQDRSSAQITIMELLPGQSRSFGPVAVDPVSSSRNREINP